MQETSHKDTRARSHLLAAVLVLERSHYRSPYRWQSRVYLREARGREKAAFAPRITPLMAGMRNLVCLQLLALTLAGSSTQADGKSGKEAGNAGNFMEDEQWLATISQYSPKIRHWNRFRDVSWRFFYDYTRIIDKIKQEL
ncbi:hypothetical protein SRHO_G00157030 [Serrasalmus rhombeus]